MPKRVRDTVWARRNVAASVNRGDVELVGVIDRVIFHDPEEGAIIAALKTGETVRGTLGIGDDALDPGVAYRFLGQWTNHYRYGPQFSFDTLLLHQAHDL